ncbi:hypothetical protein ALP07_01899 [Pseudomonas savastanoi pv. glycinea]|nr:hypothetical protein ALP07_01899 [Pseudomonas savastanoi pv. glycinea]
MGDTASQLTNRFHLLRLAQGILSLSQAFLLSQPFADIVGKQIRANGLALCIAKRAVTHFEVAGRILRIAEADAFGKLLACQRPRPALLKARFALRTVVQQVEHIVAYLRTDAKKTLELA